MPTSIKKSENESLRIPALRILSSNVADKERVSFIKNHVAAIKRCGHRTLQHTWLAGRECMYIKARSKLHGKAWAAFCQENFGVTDRQMRDIMKVYRLFPSLRAIPANIVSIRSALDHATAAKAGAGTMSRRSAQLRVAQRRLTEISKADATMFRKVCAFIRTEHATLV